MRQPRIVTWFCVATIIMLVVACKKPAIRKFVIHPLYVCTGERIHFEWDITNIDGIKIYKNGNDRIHSGDRKGSWNSPVVQADWDYVRFKGCKGGSCRSFNFDVEIVDEPTWTRVYAHQASGGQSGGTIEFLGGPEIVDTVRDPASQAKEGLFMIRRMLDGYAINPPDADFSPRARVLKVKVDGIDNGLFGVDVNGMDVEANGTPPVPRFFVAEGASSSLATPVSPRDRRWFLYYPAPQNVIVATQYGRGADADRTETSINLFPAISFEVKCLDAP